MFLNSRCWRDLADSDDTAKELAEALEWTGLRLCCFQNGARQYFGMKPE